MEGLQAMWYLLYTTRNGQKLWTGPHRTKLAAENSFHSTLYCTSPIYLQESK